MAKKRFFLGGGFEMMLCVVCQCSVVFFEGFWLFLLYSFFLGFLLLGFRSIFVLSWQ